MGVTSAPVILTIAGADPTCGAGIQADIDVIRHLGCQPLSAITMLTAQNKSGVQTSSLVEVAIVEAQLVTLIQDYDIRAVKIGVLGSTTMIDLVCRIIDKHHLKNIVIDPIITPTQGQTLQSLAVVDYCCQRLGPHVSVITPNINEAQLLTGMTISDQVSQQAAANQLAKQYRVAILVKGGDLIGTVADDVLINTAVSATPIWFRQNRVVTQSCRGTGCQLSSAIAVYLAGGVSLPVAIEAAKRLVTNKLKCKGTSLDTGSL